MSHDSEFLIRHAPHSEQKKIHRRHFLTVGLIVAAILIGLLAIWTAVNVGLSSAALLDGRDNLIEAKSAAENFSFEEAKSFLSKAETDFSKANTCLHRVGWLKIVPWFGSQVSAAETMLDSSANLFAVVERLADLGAEITRLVGQTEDTTEGLAMVSSLKYDEMTPAVKRLVLQRLNGAAPDFALLAEQVGLIKNELNDLKETPDPIGAVARQLDESLSRAYQALNLMATVTRLIPAFAGLDEEKKFLLLLENNTELRPAGGFIGTYGILRVKDGEIVELELKDSYLLDQAAAATWSAVPPQPLQKYLAVEKWFFRDSNWSPDFSVSARNAISMFTSEVLSIPAEARVGVQQPLSFDGVIALTPTFVSDLLKITGPITVSGQTFTADNIADALEYQVEKGFQENGLPYEQRKEIITVLFNEMKTKIFDLSFSAWPPVFAAVEKNLSDKQIVLFDGSSSGTEEIIQKAGWGGVVESGVGDFLMVIDANLASLKTDPKILRNISYSIKPSEEGRFIGKVTIWYDHQGQFDWKTTRYRTYTRVYVPLGSEFIAGIGMMANDKLKNPSGAVGTVDVSQELGLTVFGAFISVEPGESGELSFEYYLPASVVDQIESGDYSLRIVKQIGAIEPGLTTELNFGKKVTSAWPAELEHFWGDETYSGAFGLAKDLSINVSFD